MSTIYVGMTDRKARFPHERQRDDAPYVPLHELHAALEANRSLVAQISRMSDDKRVIGWNVMAGAIIGSFAAIMIVGAL